jgi:hypothetical protein
MICPSLNIQALFNMFNIVVFKLFLTGDVDLHAEKDKTKTKVVSIAKDDSFSLRTYHGHLYNNILGISPCT